jgi:hypothetical protein
LEKTPPPPPGLQNLSSRNVFKEAILYKKLDTNSCFAKLRARAGRDNKANKNGNKKFSFLGKISHRKNCSMHRQGNIGEGFIPPDKNNNSSNSMTMV